MNFNKFQNQELTHQELHQITGGWQPEIVPVGAEDN